MAKISVWDSVGIKLSVKHQIFVTEYMRDRATRRAAEAAGYDPDAGYKLLMREDIQQALEYMMQHRFTDAIIDADWHLEQLVGNHEIARQQGNIAASNSSLLQIGKHKRVDAFAADKIKVTTDADVVDRLVAARRRVAGIDQQTSDDDDVSFL